MWSPRSNSFILSVMRSRNRNTFFTVVILGIIILTVLLSYCIFGEAAVQESDPSLLVTHILFRHGERSPQSFYESDPYKDPKYWPDGLGQLNKRGKLQLYKVGQMLRLRYQNKLPAAYNPSDLLVRSSYADRCQMSAQTLLAGMYPPTASQIWNKDLLWQPIPINSVPRDQDNVIVIGKPCPKYKQLKEKVLNELSKNLTSEQKELFDFLTEHTGEKVSTIADVESLYFTLLVERDHGLTLPEWTKDVFPKKMEPVAELMQASLSWDLSMQRFSSGELLRLWRDRLKSASEGKRSPKVLMYSGHDVTMMSALRALGFRSVQLADYGSTLILELKRSHSFLYVELFYYNSSEAKEAVQLSIPGCKSPCVLDSFLSIIESVIPTNWDQECLS